jgi:hypothetical protein
MFNSTEQSSDYIGILLIIIIYWTINITFLKYVPIFKGFQDKNTHIHTWLFLNRFCLQNLSDYPSMQFKSFFRVSIFHIFSSLKGFWNCLFGEVLKLLDTNGHNNSTTCQAQHDPYYQGQCHTWGQR